MEIVLQLDQRLLRVFGHQSEMVDEGHLEVGVDLQYTAAFLLVAQSSTGRLAQSRVAESSQP